VRAPGGTSLHVIARASGVSARDVFELNQHYVRGVTPPGRPSHVRIPEGHARLFESNFARVSRGAQQAP